MVSIRGYPKQQFERSQRSGLKEVCCEHNTGYSKSALERHLRNHEFRLADAAGPQHHVSATAGCATAKPGPARPARSIPVCWATGAIQRTQRGNADLPVAAAGASECIELGNFEFRLWQRSNPGHPITSRSCAHLQCDGSEQLSHSCRVESISFDGCSSGRSGCASKFRVSSVNASQPSNSRSLLACRTSPYRSPG